MSQTIIEAEANILDYTTSPEPSQAGLPMVERGLTVGRRPMYQTPSACTDRQQGLSGTVTQTARVDNGPSAGA